MGRDATAELHSGRCIKGNWNVVALAGYDSSGNNDGDVIERYSYTPYGEFIVLKAGLSEVGNEERLFDAGVADEEGELSEGDSCGPEPAAWLGLDVGGEAEGGVEVGVGGGRACGLRLRQARGRGGRAESF